MPCAFRTSGLWRSLLWMGLLLIGLASCAPFDSPDPTPQVEPHAELEPQAPMRLAPAAVVKEKVVARLPVDAAQSFAVYGTVPMGNGNVVIYRLKDAQGWPTVGHGFVELKGDAWQMTSGYSTSYEPVIVPGDPPRWAKGEGPGFKVLSGPIYDQRVVVAEAHLKDGRTVSSVPSLGMFAFVVRDTTEVCSIELLDAERRSVGHIGVGGCS